MLEQVFIILFEQSKQSSKQQATTKSRSVEKSSCQRVHEKNEKIVALPRKSPPGKLIMVFRGW